MLYKIYQNKKLLRPSENDPLLNLWSRRDNKPFSHKLIVLLHANNTYIFGFSFGGFGFFFKYTQV